MEALNLIQFTTVSSPRECTQILDLQSRNHASALSAAVKADQGFLTVRHEPSVLQRMNEHSPSIIAKANDQVVGYALVMPPAFAAEVPILQPMFDLLYTLSWQGQALREQARWFVMGQVCVAEGYRGQGVFDGLYAKMKAVCAADYDFTVTEIAARNSRSLRAHARVGFETLQVYDDALTGETWQVVGLSFVER